jgi:glutamate racemase
MKALPNEKMIYFGDTARTPYGSKAISTIQSFSNEIAEFLVQCNVKMIVIACNTVSATCLDMLRERFPQIPILGIIDPAAYVTANKYSVDDNIGIIATKVTINSGAYTEAIHKYNKDMHIYETACPAFVPLIEEDIIENEIMDLTIKYYMDDFIKEHNLDTVILGCTHYPLILEKIKKYLPSNINIISQGDIVGQSLKDYLNRHPEIEAKCSKNAHIEFLTTESADKFNASAALFLNKKINAKHINIL